MVGSAASISIDSYSNAISFATDPHMMMHDKIGDFASTFFIDFCFPFFFVALCDAADVIGDHSSCPIIVQCINEANASLARATKSFVRDVNPDGRASIPPSIPAIIVFNSLAIISPAAAATTASSSITSLRSKACPKSLSTT